ncbi:hypothetical protein PENSPDRAFT_199791 [Peniophora sp. CONT]|nr:hypothetical protein PENSPDRAFT_199791 [Peniophora sp. CONT]
MTHLPSFSLVGALEFRHVVAGLQSQAAGSSLTVFESPHAIYPGGHYHGHGSIRSRTPTPTPGQRGGLDDELNPWDASLGAVPLDERTRATPPTPGITVEADDSLAGSVPTIIRTPASPVLPSTIERPSKRRKALRALHKAFHILFPTLHDLGCKSYAGMIASIFAAPAVFALTLTLPVIVMPYDSSSLHHEKAVLSTDPLIQFEEEGVERALIGEEEVTEEMHANPLEFNKWLMGAQCTLGPLFCVGVLFKGRDVLWWMLLGAGVVGLAVGTLVVAFAKDGEHRLSRAARCSMGFFVAMVWIMAIADEVVNVLQTFGFIFGLSDAIIGLTIFAVGNSLADLVANMSVAVFAPIMGFSACFGGPMLNMLLGVGISGSYITSQTGVPYQLHFSTTLLVSAIGLLTLLLATAVFVPLNGYFLPRAWGVFLIVAYVVLMTVNVVVEVLSES